MRFKSRLPKSPEIYQKATVFIFSGAGDLLLEQEFPVNLSAPSASSQTSSSSSSAPALDD